MYCRSPLTMLAELPGWAWRGLTGGPTLTFLRHRAALGDMLMLTPLLRALKKHRPELRLAMASRSPELFFHNPHLDENRDWHLAASRGTVRLRYRLENARHPHYVEDMWCDLWDFLMERGWAEGERPELDGRHPEMFLTEGERSKGHELLAKQGRPVIALVSDGKTKPTHNREWGFENYQAVVAALAPHADLLQISGERHLVLPGGEVLRQVRTDIRSAAALLAASDGLLTQEGGLMHVARAVNAPAVIIFGGSLHPTHSGYDRVVNLFSQPSCSPCMFRRENCFHLKCMVPITPREVVRQLTKVLAQKGMTLPEEAVQSAPDTWTPPAFIDRALLEKEWAAEAGALKIS